MAVWSYTKSEIDQHLRTTFQRLSGSPTVTYMEGVMISDAINAALIDLCMDYGLSRFTFTNKDVTSSTTANQSYVDLDQHISSIIAGTVRIPDENVVLSLMNLEYMHNADPDANRIDRPAMYGFDISPNPDLFRLQFWPIPDKVYSIQFTARKLVDENAVEGIPHYLHFALKDKAKANFLRDVGFYQDAAVFDAAYLERKRNTKAALEPDAPLVVRRVGVNLRSNIQERAN